MSNPYQERDRLRQMLNGYARTAWPGSRCIALWPDGVAGVYILDRGGRLRDVTYHSHPEMIEVLKERYPGLEDSKFVYLEPVSDGAANHQGRYSIDLDDFFAGRNMLKLKESYP